MVSCLACDHKVEGSIPCQAEATLLIRSKIVLFPPFRLQLTFLEIMSVLLKCLRRPRSGLLHVQLVISDLVKARDLIERKKITFINCTPLGLSLLISI